MKLAQLRLLLSRGGSRSLFLVITIASVISVALVISLAILIARIVVLLVQGESSITREILAVFSLWIFRAIFQSQYEYWTTLQAIRIKERLRHQVTSTLPRFTSTSPAVLTNLLVKGFNSLDIFLGRFLPQMASAVVTPIAVIATIFIFDPLSALIAILTLPLIPVFGALIGKYTAESFEKKWESLGTLSRYFEDSLRGFVTLRIFGRHKSQARRIKEMGDEYTGETMKVLRVSFLSAFALELCATISVALIAVGIGLRLVEGDMTFIAGLTVLLLAPEVYSPLRNAASLFHASADGKASLDEIETLFSSASDLVPQTERDFSNFQTLSWSEWTIDIHGVAKSKLPAAEISRNQTLFIVGDSGTGKTTFAKNLIGLSSGAELMIDGKIELIPELSDSWQKIVGWIPQVPHLAPGTLAEQFRTIQSGISDFEIAERLRLVGLDLIDLPHGLGTLVGGTGEKSAAVSGGQLRKIAIARALLNKPALVVADEPSADLDEVSTRLIMKELRKFVQEGAALICITHDTAIIHGDDRVISMNEPALDEGTAR